MVSFGIHLTYMPLDRGKVETLCGLWVAPAAIASAYQRSNSWACQERRMAADGRAKRRRGKPSWSRSDR
jgi:hypothetical protein